MNNSLILTNINKSYFWDIDINTLDDKKSKRLIIERVINLGNLKELKFLFNYYGEKEVINTIQRLNYLDSKTLNFFSLIFYIPKNKFKCFTKKRLTTTHWSS